MKNATVYEKKQPLQKPNQGLYVEAIITLNNLAHN